jgi:hypothetical protein
MFYRVSFLSVCVNILSADIFSAGLLFLVINEVKNVAEIFIQIGEAYEEKIQD